MTDETKNYTLHSAIEQLRLCGYMCEGGPLEKNTAFIALESRLHTMARIVEVAKLALDDHDPKKARSCLTHIQELIGK